MFILHAHPYTVARDSRLHTDPRRWYQPFIAGMAKNSYGSQFFYWSKTTLYGTGYLPLVNHPFYFLIAHLDREAVEGGKGGFDSVYAQ